MNQSRADRPRAPSLPGPLRAAADLALRVPLLLKILAANVAVAVVAGALALAVAQGLAREPVDGAMLALGLVFVAGVLAIGALLHAFVVRMALSPLQFLLDAAERVRGGEFHARAPLTPLADRPTRHLIETFNRMLDSLQVARETERDLALRVLQAEERERERVARELYAGTAQTLSAILVRLELEARKSSRDDGPLVPPASAADPRDPFAEIRQQVSCALREVRAVARRLRPPELDELGLASALEAHARQLEETRQVRVRISAPPPCSRCGKDQELVLFRIAQEAMTNAACHSGGRTVEVLFTSGPDALTMDVEDDGHGFLVPERVSGTGSRFGLTGMRERAGHLGGTLSITARATGGTRVRLRIPWPPGKPGDPADRRAEPPPAPNLPTPSAAGAR